MDRLTGKVALVTGGTSGIGAATVERLCAEGAQVVFTGRNVDAGRRVSEATGARFHAQDLEDRRSWDPLMAMIGEQYGRLDVAFANAGMEGADTNIEDIALEAWDRIVEVNLTSVMITAQRAIGLMKSNPGGSSGSIILNSSMNGMMALSGNIAYSTTKGALRLLAKSVAMHCAVNDLNIRCNSIHPGVVETQLVRDALAAAPDPAAARSKLENMSPMKRMGRLEEVAALVAFLASDDAAFISGSEYLIDGASTAGMVGV